MPLRMPSLFQVHRRNDHWWPYASWCCHSACQQNLPMYHLLSRPLKNWDTLKLDGCLRCSVDILTQSDLVFIIFQRFHVIFGTTLSHGTLSSITEIVSFLVIDLKTQLIDEGDTINTYVKPIQEFHLRNLIENHAAEAFGFSDWTIEYIQRTQISKLIQRGELIDGLKMYMGDVRLKIFEFLNYLHSEGFRRDSDGTSWEDIPESSPKRHDYTRNIMLRSLPENWCYSRSSPKRERLAAWSSHPKILAHIRWTISDWETQNRGHPTRQSPCSCSCPTEVQ